jgi:hypothetical protein
MKPRLYRPDGPPTALGDPFEGEVGPVVEDKDQSDVVVEWSHRTNHFVLIEERLERVTGGVSAGDFVDCDQADVAPSAQAISTHIYQDAVEPHLKAGRIAKGGRTPPGSKERVLRRVLRLMSVTKEQTGPAVGPVKLPVGQAEELISGG